MMLGFLGICGPMFYICIRDGSVALPMVCLSDLGRPLILRLVTIVSAGVTVIVLVCTNAYRLKGQMVSSMMGSMMNFHSWIHSW